MRILGFTGAPGAGKTALAQALCDTADLETTVVRLSMADPVREAARALFALHPAQFTRELYDGPLSERAIGYRPGGVTPRRLVAALDDAVSRIAPGARTAALCRRLSTIAVMEIGHPTRRTLVVVDDLRDDRDVQCVRDAGGLVVRVVRPDDVRARDDVRGEHSEVINDGALVQLAAAAHTVQEWAWAPRPHNVSVMTRQFRCALGVISARDVRA